MYISKVAVVLLCCLLVVACSGKDVRPVDDRPAWVDLEGGAFPDDPTKIYAVGINDTARSVAIQRSSAMTRGRAELSRVFGTYVESMAEDYMNYASDGERLTEEQYHTQVTRVLTDQFLGGSYMADTYTDDDGTLYVLMVLDLARFQNLAGGADALPQDVRDHIEQRAQAGMDRMDEALDSRSSR